MASPIRKSSIFFFFCSLLLILIALSEASDNGPLTLLSDNDEQVDGVHDLLNKYGFPKGVFPDNVKSFNFSENGAVLRVQLQKPCTLSLVIRYGARIRARLAYGSMSRVNGIRGKTEHGFWLTVVAIKLNETSNTVGFSIGGLFKYFPATDFDVSPACETKLFDLQDII